jgi:hypothetical protein
MDEVVGDTVNRNKTDDHQPMHPNVGEHAQPRGNRPQPSLNPNTRPEQAASQTNSQRRHGYAAVEIHKGAARIIRWEVEDSREPSPEQSDNQRRLFRLGEWLSKQPISNQARAEYFDIERVS